jgi:hypothetical protein
MAKKKGPGKRNSMASLNRNVSRLAARLEASNIQDYIDLTHRPVRMAWNNFLSGLARGVGLFLGAGAMGALTIAVVGALLVWLLNFLNMIPVLGDLAGVLQSIFRDFLQKHTQH